MLLFLEKRFEFRTEMHIKLKDSYKVKKWTRHEISPVQATFPETAIDTPVRSV